METRKRILELENFEVEEVMLERVGHIPVLLSAPHTMMQERQDGTVKKSEPFTKAIALYVAEMTDSYAIVKTKDTRIDANSREPEEYKESLLKMINAHKINLVLDIHGAKEERDFDIEFGTLKNISADYSTIKELEDAFNEQGILNIKHNEPFLGGGITREVFSNTEVDVIQIEINKKFRDVENIEKIESVCDALISFIKMYVNFTGKF